MNGGTSDAVDFAKSGLKEQLKRFAPAALIDSQAFLAVAIALLDEAKSRKNASESHSQPPGWVQLQLTEIARTACEFGAIDAEYIRSDQSRRLDDARVLVKAAEVLERHPGEAFLVAGLRGRALSLPSKLRQGSKMPRRLRNAAKNIAIPRKDDTSVRYLEYLGHRGGAGNADGARRGAVIRKFDELVPKSTPNRYSVIAKFLTLSGQETTPNLVRAILKEGRT